MLRHVVTFSWQGHVTDADIIAVGAALDRLAEQIPQIAQYRHGPDAGLNSANHDYAIVGDFATADDYLVYRDHPDHQRFIADHITGHVAGRSTVPFHC